MKMHVLKYKRQDYDVFSLANEVVYSAAPFITLLGTLFNFNLYRWVLVSNSDTYRSLDDFIRDYQANIIATIDVEVRDTIIMNPEESLLKLKELIPEEFI